MLSDVVKHFDLPRQAHRGLYLNCVAAPLDLGLVMYRQIQPMTKRAAASDEI